MDASWDMAITGWDTKGGRGGGERIPLEPPAIWHMLRIPLQHLLWDMANVARDNAQNLGNYGNHGLGYAGVKGRIPLESLAIWHMLRFVSQQLRWDMTGVALDNAQILVGYGNRGLGYKGRRGGRISLESPAIWHMLRNPTTIAVGHGQRGLG